MTISVSAQVNNAEPKFELSPFNVEFGDVLVGRKSDMSLTLTNIDSTKSKIVIVESPSSEYIKKTRIKKTKLKPGAATDIEFHLAKDIPLGPFATALTIEAKDKPDSRVTIPISGKIVEKTIEPEEKASK